MLLALGCIDTHREGTATHCTRWRPYIWCHKLQTSVRTQMRKKAAYDNAKSNITLLALETLNRAAGAGGARMTYLTAQEEALRVEVEGHVPFTLRSLLSCIVEVDSCVIDCNVQCTQL